MGANATTTEEESGQKPPTTSPPPHPSDNAVRGILAYLSAAYPETHSNARGGAPSHDRGGGRETSPAPSDDSLHIEKEDENDKGMVSSSSDLDVDLPDLKTLLADSSLRREDGPQRASPHAPPHVPPPATPRGMETNNPFGCLNCLFNL